MVVCESLAAYESAGSKKFLNVSPIKFRSDFLVLIKKKKKMKI